MPSDKNSLLNNFVLIFIVSVIFYVSNVVWYSDICFFAVRISYWSDQLTKSAIDQQKRGYFAKQKRNHNNSVGVP
jgi:hypothetical protein